MVNFFSLLAIVLGICFFIWCLIIHKRAPNKMWLLASGLLSVSIVFSGLINLPDTYRGDKSKLENIEG